MEIQILENEALDLLSKIEKERQLVIDILYNLSERTGAPYDELLSAFYNNKISEKDFYFDYKDMEYKYLIEDLKRNINDCYDDRWNRSHCSFWKFRTPEFDSDYFKQLKNNIFFQEKIYMFWEGKPSRILELIRHANRTAQLNSRELQLMKKIL